MNYKEAALSTYSKFSTVDGNQHIASDFAIQQILMFIKHFKVQTILEIGLGIGSICDAVLVHNAQETYKIDYSGTESNEFCLDALKKNVTNYNDIKLYADIAAIDVKQKFDFIIVDGSDDSLEKVKIFLNINGFIFIEGGRFSQVTALKKIFPKCIFAEIISLRKPPLIGPFQQPWAGGGGLIFTNPTIFQNIYCFYQKVRTFVVRRLRKLV